MAKSSTPLFTAPELASFLEDALFQVCQTHPQMKDALHDLMEAAMWAACEKLLPGVAQWGTCQGGDAWRMHLMRCDGHILELFADYHLYPQLQHWRIRDQTYDQFIHNTLHTSPLKSHKEAALHIPDGAELLKLWKHKNVKDLVRPHQNFQAMVEALESAMTPLVAHWQAGRLHQQTPENALSSSPRNKVRL